MSDRYATICANCVSPSTITLPTTNPITALSACYACGAIIDGIAPRNGWNVLLERRVRTVVNSPAPTDDEHRNSANQAYAQLAALAAQTNGAMVMVGLRLDPDRKTEPILRYWTHGRALELPLSQVDMFITAFRLGTSTGDRERARMQRAEVVVDLVLAQAMATQIDEQARHSKALR